MRYSYDLTFVGPCIVIYFCSKTNQIQNILNLFYFGTTLYMFRTVSPSIIRSLRLYIQHHTIQVLWLLASGPASKQPQNLYDIYLMLYVQVLDSWWWTEGPSETCTVLFQNKINLRYCASGWFYYRNTGWSKSLCASDDCIVVIRCTETFWSPCILRCTVFQTSTL